MIELAIIGLFVGLVLIIVGRARARAQERVVMSLVYMGVLTSTEAVQLLWSMQTGLPLPPDFGAREIHNVPDTLPSEWSET